VTYTDLELEYLFITSLGLLTSEKTMRNGREDVETWFASPSIPESLVEGARIAEKMGLSSENALLLVCMGFTYGVTEALLRFTQAQTPVTPKVLH